MKAAHANIEFSISSETGRLRDAIVCRPTYYSWRPSNSIVMKAITEGEKPDRLAAATQHDELVAALTEAGVTCHFVEPDLHLPYQTYTRDSAFMTPWGLVICCMARLERRAEWSPLLSTIKAIGVPFWKTISAGILEGGDIQVLAPQKLLIGVNGVRTDEAGAQQLADWFSEQGWETRLIRFPAHFLHLDVLFSMAAENIALCATEILDPADVSWLRAQDITILPVGYSDVVRMGCNVVALGDDRVISAMQHPEINKRLRAEGLTVFDPNLNEFITEGGASHCLTQPLRRD